MDREIGIEERRGRRVKRVAVGVAVATLAVFAFLALPGWLRPELEARRITCSWVQSDPVPPVSLDKNQIEQVLVNVLRNAMESIGEDGRIELGLVRDAHGPALTVADSGAGIPPTLQSQLFTPFFSTKRDGRGLGLTVIQEILAAHRFDFALEPRPEGGAQFRIELADGAGTT